MVLVVWVACACAERPSDRVLVTSGFTDQVFVLDAVTGALVDSLDLDRRPGERDEPHGVAVSPDGEHFYVTLSHGEPTLWKYEARDLRLVGRVTVPTNGASRVRLSPDGTLAAVPDYWLSGGGAVSRIAFVRTEDLTVVGTPEVCSAPHDAAFSPLGDQIAVACTGSDEILILRSPGFDSGQKLAAAAGTRPLNAAWRDDGTEVLVTTAGAERVYRLVADASAAPGHRATRSGAQIEIAGATAVVANRAAGTVTLLDLDSDTERVVEMPGAHPHGVALSPDGRVAYVTYEGTTDSRGGVVAIELTGAHILWHTPVGIMTLGVAYLPASPSVSASRSSEQELMQ